MSDWFEILDHIYNEMDDVTFQVIFPGITRTRRKKMDPVFIAMLAKLGIDTAISLIDAWKKSGEPSAEEIRAAFITKPPEDYFK